MSIPFTQRSISDVPNNGQDNYTVLHLHPNWVTTALIKVWLLAMCKRKMYLSSLFARGQKGAVRISFSNEWTILPFVQLLVSTLKIFVSLCRSFLTTMDGACMWSPCSFVFKCDSNGFLLCPRNRKEFDNRLNLHGNWHSSLPWLRQSWHAWLWHRSPVRAVASWLLSMNKMTISVSKQSFNC